MRSSGHMDSIDEVPESPDFRSRGAMSPDFRTRSFLRPPPINTTDETQPKEGRSNTKSLLRRVRQTEGSVGSIASDATGPSKKNKKRSVQLSYRSRLEQKELQAEQDRLNDEQRYKMMFGISLS